MFRPQKGDRPLKNYEDENLFGGNKPSLITIYNLDYLFNISLRFAYEHEIFSNDLGQLCLVSFGCFFIHAIGELLQVDGD